SAGTQQIRVTYDNDLWRSPGGAGNDRNLLLDKVDVLCGSAVDAGADGGTDGGTDGGAGACTPANCGDRLPCQIGTCTSGTCSYAAASDGTACSDTNSCTINDQCASGTCTGTPVSLSPPPCITRTCDPATGIHDAPSAAGTACPNGSLCDGSETCDGAGTCQSGTPPVIDDGNPCTTDACDPVTGVSHTPRPAGADCSTDNDVCNGIETCNGAGTCAPGTPPTLDDGNVCTLDACSATTGVTHTPIPNCDPTPVQGDAPFESRASILGRTLSSTGATISGVTFTVYDERVAGAPRADVAATVGADGSFKIKLTAFPDAEPDRSPPHRLILVIDSPGTIRAYREGYAHVGTALDLGDIRLIARDPAVTNIGPAGGTASDSQGLVQLVVPAGALATTVPIQITPLQQRADFPAPLPESTLTMYGFELEPSGTTFTTPATVRLANYRNLPTTLSIPTGSYDPVENRWDHEGVAVWDGTRFAVPVSHFSTWDANKGALSDLVLKIERGSNPNAGAEEPCVGSSWGVGGGGIEQGFVLPRMQVRGENVSLSLHYASGLAGSRKLGAAPAATGSAPAVPHGTLAVSIPSVKVTAMCVAAGGGGGGTQPGTCSVAGGKCGLGGGGASSIGSSIAMLAESLAQIRALAAQATDADFSGWVEMPLAGPDQIAETGLVTQTVTVTSNAISACAAGGGIFGVPDPIGPGVQLPSVGSGALMTASRKVLVNHRFSSPFGAGWAIREVSRVYTDGDLAELVSGEGQEEEFRPRATVTATPVGLGEMALARDRSTGEIFAAIEPGRIARLDPTTGAPTDILTGAPFSSGDFPRVEGLAVAYVAGARHFVVATAVALVDIDGGGARRVLAPRTGGVGLFKQASVAALDDVVFYTDGDDTKPLVYRVRLSDPTPALQALSALTGDVRLQPKQPLGSVQFGGPRGLAISQDGSLLVADFRRHVVYAVDPSAAGAIDATSHVRIALGMGTGSYVAAAGERQPALAYSLNQPAALAVAEDGTVLVLSSYGMTYFDPVAREAELLFLDGGRDEITADLGSPAQTASFVALTGTSLLGRAVDQSTAATIVRVDVERLSSTQNPTRVLRKLPGIGAGFELTDTTAAAVWRFDADGRMIEQRKRTGELDFSVEYTAPRTGRIARIVDAVGGAHVFAYSGTKIASITDPAGRVTQINVDAQGDLSSIVEPDGETHAFVYAGHRMLTKTSPRGDVTAYTYAPDGTVATSTKPGGETYSFEPALAAPPSYTTAGASVRTGAYTDARGVRHAFTTDIFGAIDSETYTADGVTRTVTAVHPDILLPPAGSPLSPRKNAFRRTSHLTVNGVALSPPVLFDTLGRPVRQPGVVASGDLHRWDYASDGWLLESFSGPSNTAQRIARDAAGHVLRVFDAAPQSGGLLPSGREISFTWRADGQPATMTEHGITTTFTYDDLGSHNVVLASDTLGRTTSLGYDAFGNVTSTSDGTASASFVFDLGNRLRTSRDALGNETTFRYENIDCGCTEQDEVTGVHTPDLPAGVEWAMTYGAQGRIASVTDPQGFTESYTYEPTGELKTVKDRLARTTTMAHDQLGRLLAMVDTLGRSHGRSYSVPAAAGWQGPTLTAGSADATVATGDLATQLRDGDYQIGVNALQANGFPAQISLYRDATFALGFTHVFDNAMRPQKRDDRASLAIDSTAIPNTIGSFWNLQSNYDLRTSAPLTNNVNSIGVPNAGATWEWASVEFDLVSTTGFGAGVATPATYAYTRDAGGRVTSHTNVFSTSGLASDPTAPQIGLITYGSTYSYYPDGRLASVSNADGGRADSTLALPSNSLITASVSAGTHAFTYDARGLLATQTDFDGTYRYTYDELGRNKRLEFPDGHARVQIFDDLGRITSRCYEYADPSQNRCYGAAYDPVGNPVHLSDPEGSDVYEYDALDRLTKVTRLDGGGLTVSVEDYAFNALGAMKVHASLPVDHRRPRLDGAGVADAAVP
ncbi:MAG: Rhs family protein, partial [Myxococcaceae bacterium]|nr:Rhs family protein [Myxococcaceae bacterium]